MSMDYLTFTFYVLLFYILFFLFSFFSVFFRVVLERRSDCRGKDGIHIVQCSAVFYHSMIIIRIEWKAIFFSEVVVYLKHRKNVPRDHSLPGFKPLYAAIPTIDYGTWFDLLKSKLYGNKIIFQKVDPNDIFGV